MNLQPRWTIANADVGTQISLKKATKKSGALSGETIKVLVAEFRGEGTTVQAWQFFPSLRVLIDKADGDIDEDGANGQRGAPAGYMVGDKGREYLANGGMAMRGGKVVGITDWYDDIVILGDNAQPKVFPGGIIASKTAYRYAGVRLDNPAAYLDAETVPYGVVSPRIRNRAKGIVLGCRMIITNTANGKIVECVTGDSGPSDKIGELSPAAARPIGIPDSPRTGGTEKLILRYELFPGTPAVIGHETFRLIAA